MAFTVKTKKNEIIKLEDKYFASGGEGVIHKIVSHDKFKNYCVKIYKDCLSRKNDKSIKEREQKIDYMVKNPPSKLTSNHWLLTWPIELVYENSGNFLGFIMPLAFDKSVLLFELTNLKNKSYLPNDWDRFNRKSSEGFKRRLMLSANIAIAVHHIHASNKYVIVDMKPQNFLVSPEGKVSVLDIDTIQISENWKVLFPSKAMTPEYLPPEINNMVSSDKIQVEWDRFILSVIFYEVLIGLHPFAGNGFKPPYSNSTTIKENISNGLFPFGQKKHYFNVIPKPHQNFNNIPLKVQNLFIDTFDKGLIKPDSRPSAEMWGKILYNEITSENIQAVSSEGIQNNKTTTVHVASSNSVISDKSSTRTKLSGGTTKKTSTKKLFVSLSVAVALIIILFIALPIKKSSKNNGNYTENILREEETKNTRDEYSKDKESITTLPISNEKDEKQSISTPISSEKNENTPLSITRQFLEYLGNQDCNNAYSLQNNKSWGKTSSRFCEMFGSIKQVTIKNIYTEQEDSYNSKVYVDIVIRDETSKHGEYTQYRERYFLEKNNYKWKIKKMEVLYSAPY